MLKDTSSCTDIVTIMVVLSTSSFSSDKTVVVSINSGLIVVVNGSTFGLLTDKMSISNTRSELGGMIPSPSGP